MQENQLEGNLNKGKYIHRDISVSTALPEPEYGRKMVPSYKPIKIVFIKLLKAHFGSAMCIQWLRAKEKKQVHIYFQVFFTDLEQSSQECLRVCGKPDKASFMVKV